LSFTINSATLFGIRAVPSNARGKQACAPTQCAEHAPWEVRRSPVVRHQGCKQRRVILTERSEVDSESRRRPAVFTAQLTQTLVTSPLRCCRSRSTDGPEDLGTRRRQVLARCRSTYRRLKNGHPSNAQRSARRGKSGPSTHRRVKAANWYNEALNGRGLTPSGATKALLITRFLRKVSEGTRTPDRLDHNQELYQLSYAHREATESSNGSRPGEAAVGSGSDATGD
jgi:hypothetical protein